MKHGSANITSIVRLIAISITWSVLAAHADEYTDINQLIRSGKLAEAQARVERSLSARPRDVQLRFLKGVIQRDSGRAADAIATFTRLTEEHPELPEPYNNLAVIYASQSQFDKARAALEMAIRTNPSYATAHENLGDVYAKLASQAYNKALQIDSSNTAVQPKLALIRELFNPVPPGQRAAAPAPTPVAAVPAIPTVVAQARPVLAPAPAPTPAPAPAKPVVKPSLPVATPAVTPAPAPVVVPTQVGADEGPAKEVETAVQAWAKAWADKNMAGYLGAYGKEFTPVGNQSRSAWEEDRRQRITGKSRISVNLLNLNVTVHGEQAVAKFQQDYKADALAVLSRKTLELVKTQGRWLIVKETSGN
jgi:tetratricopeptide (TPR) repeat protein